MDLVVVFLLICAIAWLRKGWALEAGRQAAPGLPLRTFIGA
jgi:hypothetical protein